MKVTILALTLNEISGMKVIMPQIKREWVDQIIVLDGGSTDGTVEWAKENGFEVYVQKKPGLRHAYIEVMPLVKGDVILTISPDGNCAVDFIPQILEAMRMGCDMVIGSRYFGKFKSQDDDFMTGFGNWLFTKTVNLLYGTQFTDVMVIYRAYRKDLFYELDMHLDETYSLYERLFNTKIGVEPILTVRAAKLGKRVIDVGVGEPPRIGGHRKLQMFRWGASFYLMFWRELWFWKTPRPAAVNSAKTDSSKEYKSPAS